MLIAFTLALQSKLGTKSEQPPVNIQSLLWDITIFVNWLMRVKFNHSVWCTVYECANCTQMFIFHSQT